MMKLSVIIPVYNETRAVEKIQEKSHPRVRDFKQIFLEYRFIRLVTGSLYGL